MAPTVSAVSGDVRRIDPPRAVEVLHDGTWVPAWNDGWVWWPEPGEWRASVTYVVAHDWGRGRYVKSVPADEIRLPE